MGQFWREVGTRATFNRCGGLEQWLEIVREKKPCENTADNPGLCHFPQPLIQIIRAVYNTLIIALLVKI